MILNLNRGWSNVIKQIPQAKGKLSLLSCCAKELNKSALFPEDKLQQSGYHRKLKYDPIKIKNRK